MDSKVVFEAPLAHLKGGWLELIKTQYINCSNAVLQEEDGHAQKFHYSFLLLLNLLPGGNDGKDRHRVYEAYQKRFETRVEEEKNENGKNVPNDVLRRIRQEVELEIMGHITDFVDKYIGIHEKLVVDVVGLIGEEDIEEEFEVPE